MIRGGLRSRGILVPRQRVVDSMHQVILLVKSFEGESLRIAVNPPFLHQIAYGETRSFIYCSL